MRTIPLLLLLTLGSARAASALTIDLPVRVPGNPSSAVTAAGSYRGDLIEIRLAPAPARAALARAYGRRRADALGVSAVDRLANRLGGVWFEPEFAGETPPPVGSGEPDFTAFYLAHLPPGTDLADAIERFRALGEVASAHPIAILPVEAIPNDSLWSVSSWYYQPGNRRDIHAPEAWDITLGDTAIVVAVLDTGVLPYHPDLGGTTGGAGQIWTNWVEAAGAPGVDDDANGFVDDLHGWDFVHLAPDPLPGEDVNDPDNDPNDYAGHGTFVAGLVGAITNNVIGVAGTARNVRIMPVRMGWASTFSALGEVDMAYAAQAIRYATRMGATVINCSWASANTDGIDAAVTVAVQQGITVVSAAGNSSPFHYLGDRNDVLAVAATDANDVLAGFSNRGPWVDLTAPGVGISSTFIAHVAADSLGYRQPAYDGPINGTSFSAPLVSGAVALIQTRYLPPSTLPRLTPRGVQLRLMETADDIASQNPGLAGQYGAGRLNAYRAVTELTGSSAIHTRARSVGAPVVLATPTARRVAFLTTNRRLVLLDPVARDTVVSLDAVGTPNGHLAAADLGVVVGTALFYGTSGDGVFGVGGNGAALPGDWPQPGSAPAAMGTPAIGDVDGDGALDVVSASDFGDVWAWHADGGTLSGFPVSGLAPIQTALALTDLDGTPGVEVVAAASDGSVHAFGAGGASLSGWPVALIGSPLAPAIGRLGSNPVPAVIVAAGNQLHALGPDGSERAGFPVTLAGNAAQEPVLGDLDGDGFDEIVVMTSAPARVEVRDSSGVSLTALNWPRALPSAAQGSPVLGELSIASPGPELLFYRAGALMALNRDADSLLTFPKAGGAGNVPTLAQLDGDAALEVAAGTGVDSLYYLYDAGSGSSAAALMPWPTARANYARTGSRLYAPPLGMVHGPPPAAVVDLRVAVRTDSSVSLTWTGTGEDGTVGRPNRYVVRAALRPIDEANFATAPLQRIVPATVDAGGSEYLIFFGLEAARHYWFALKAIDVEGNLSPLSNVVAVQTTVGGPIGNREGIALAVLQQPARGNAVFFWQASPDGMGTEQRIVIYDVTGRRVRSMHVGRDAGGRHTWDGRDTEGRSVPAGLYHARLLSGSFHTQTRLVLLP